MSRLHWSLLMLYLTGAAGFGGWRGPDLWSGWGVWCFLLPPIAWAVLAGLEWWRSGGPIRVAVVMGGLGVVAIAGSALGIAWGVAAGTERWSSEPAVRAVFGVGLGAAGGGLAWVYARSRRAAEPRETSGSESTGGLAETDPAVERGRDAGLS